MTAPKQDAKADLERLKSSLVEEITVAADESDATPFERHVAEALTSDDAKIKGLVDRVWGVSLPDARKAIAAVAAWNRRASPRGCDVELRAAVADAVLDACRQHTDAKRGGILSETQAKYLLDDATDSILTLINQARQPEGGGERVIWGGRGDFEPTEAMINAGLETCRPGNHANMITSFKEMMLQASIDGLVSAAPTDNADGLSDDRAVADALRPFATVYDAAFSGLSDGVDVRIDASFDLQDGIGRSRGARCVHAPVALTVGQFHAAKTAINATRPPAGKDLAGEVERLRAALIQADLKIRSYPGADQSDVEFIRAALGEGE